MARLNVHVCLRLLFTSYKNLVILELLIINILYTCVIVITAVLNFMIQRKNSEDHLVEYCEILYDLAFTACWFVVRKITPLLNFWTQICIWKIQ